MVLKTRLKMNRYDRYKDSGIPWLGDVPEHWIIMPIKFSLSMPITDGPHETPEILSDGIPFISAEAVKNDKLDFNKIKKQAIASRKIIPLL